MPAPTETSAATAGPWQYCHTYPGGQWCIHSKGRPHIILYAKKEEDAELTVRAVNSHDVLVECLKAMVLMLEHSLSGEIDPEGNPFVAGVSDCQIHPKGFLTLADCRRALASATRTTHGE